MASQSCGGSRPIPSCVQLTPCYVDRLRKSRKATELAYTQQACTMGKLPLVRGFTSPRVHNSAGSLLRGFTSPRITDKWLTHTW